MLPRHKGAKKFIQVVPSLRGLQTRAIPAGVNGPPLQTTVVIVKARYTELLLNTMLAKETHEDSCGKAKTMRPHSECSLRARGKRSVFPERYLMLQFTDIASKTTTLFDGTSSAQSQSFGGRRSPSFNL